MPLLRSLSENQETGYLSKVWIDSMATEEIIEEISKFKSLKELKITYCTYATGEFLKDLASTKLEKLDF